MRLALTLACLYAAYRWWHAKPDFEAVAFHGGWCAVAVGLTPLLLVLRAAKWRSCLMGLGETPTLSESLRSYLGALPLAMVTPGRAGELARPLYFSSPQLRQVEVSGRLLIDNWTDTLAVLLCALPGCAWLWGGYGVAAALLLFCLLALVPLWLGLVRQIFHGLAQPLIAWPRLNQARQTLLRLLPPPEAARFRILATGVGYGAAAYAIEAVQFFALLRGLGQVGGEWLAPEFFPIAGGLALVHLANSIQVTIGGIGPREGMTVWLLAKMGLSQTALLGAAFMQTALIFLLPAGVGLFIKAKVMR